MRASCLIVLLGGLVGCGAGTESLLQSDGETNSLRDAIVVEPLPDPVAAESLQQTVVMPHTKGNIVPGRNYVYCGTFQLAWNEMQDKTIGESIRLDGDPPMADVLNEQLFAKADLAEESYLAMAGKYSEGIVEEIRKERQNRFPSASLGPSVELDDPMNIFVAFSYLAKPLAFKGAYDRIEKPLVFHASGEDVSLGSFGFEDFDLTSNRNSALSK